LIYNVLFHLVYLLMLPKFLLRMRKRGGYRADFGERLFRLSEEKVNRLSEGRKIWIHAVSVGEFGVARAFMAEWRSRHPDAGFVVTVNTSTGHRIAEEALTERDVLLYPPVDSPLIVKKALETIQPLAMVLVETELWPNLLWGCRKRGVPVMLLNGRMSDRSFGRLHKVSWMTRRLYPLVDRFCMQSEQDADRVRDLGAPQGSVEVFHSVKYDGMSRDQEEELSRKDRLESAGFLKESSLILLGSSTWPGEERLLVEAFEELRESFPDVCLIVVPRHAERREEIRSELKERNVRAAFWTTATDAELGEAEVLVVDTTGELKHFTGLADRVVIGKSLYRKEGQNPLEAANAGKWILTGPGMDNFRPVMQDLREAQAVMEVSCAEEVTMALQCSLTDTAAAEAQGVRARAVVESHRGSLARSADELGKLVGHAKAQRRKGDL
jgi:3-deoxy-D-manno-octulosonic-acid transferase